MRLRDQRVLVTGGAGFIGSELCGRLLERGCEVVVFDNFSTGKAEYIESYRKNPRFTIIRGDMLKPAEVRGALEGCECVVHLAANPDVRAAEKDTKVHFEQNVVATFNLLEAMKELGTKELVFASSSVVYGVARVPTPEDYGPMLPISMYGASKLAAEGLISAYADNFGMSAVILRYANILGRHAHGVTRDFIMKLRANPRELEILGDGTQTKSYLLLEDCLDATILAAEKTNGVDVFNVGNEDWVNVRRIADIICEEMGLKGVSYRFTGKQAWMGDVKLMLLSIEKLKALGWRPKFNSEQAVRKAVRQMLGRE